MKSYPFEFKYTISPEYEINAISNVLNNLFEQIAKLINLIE